MSSAVLQNGMAAPPPLSLYIHFPWCVRKCPYCDFNSHRVRGDIPEQAYLLALRRDLESALPQVWGRPVETVFIGGGTPSLLTERGLDEVLTMIRTLLPLRPGAEITLEANPGTFEAARFKAYRMAGINRLSLGIQSFNSSHLTALGRIHDGDEARRAAEAALTLFDRVNLDLMYALPGQSLAQLDEDLDTAITFTPGHLSCYHLTLEPNTPFAASPPILPDDEIASDMQEHIESRLTEDGYRHYETSAFGRKGEACRHNLNYWQFGDYLGIGAGAHSKLSSDEGVVRQARLRHPNDYMAHAGSSAALTEQRQLARQDLAFEFMMNALRLVEGFDTGLLHERTGLTMNAIAKGLSQAEARGLISRELHAIRPTLLGRRFLNDLLGLFLE